MAQTLTHVAQVALFALAALLPIINPPGLAPVFLSMTPGASDSVRTMMAARVARNCCALLLGVMLIGSYVMVFFGLSIAVIKIAGGLLVMTTGWQLIRARQSPDAAAIVATAPPAPVDAITSQSFYPLTFPLTIGPGAISVAVTVGADARVHDLDGLTRLLGAITGILLVSSAVYVCFRFASRLLRVVGPSGSVVLLRLSAFLLLAVGVQLLCDGLVERFTS